jgi:hypothetical protein
LVARGKLVEKEGVAVTEQQGEECKTLVKRGTWRHRQ